MRDLKNNTRAVSSLVAAVRTTDATGASIDKAGAIGVAHLLSVGVGGITFSDTNKIEVIMEDSDDDSTYAAVDAIDVITDAGVTVTSGIVKSFVAAHAAAAVYTFVYRGNKRYSRIKLDYSGTHGTGTATAAIAILSGLEVAPYVA